MKKSKNPLVAIIDAATLYGAERFINHYDKYNNKSYSRNYNFIEDKKLFNDFIHNLVLYDKMIYNCNSIEFVDSEIENFINDISDYAKCAVVKPEVVMGELPEDDMSMIIQSLCEILVKSNYKKILKLINNKIPWYYSSKKHVDYYLVGKIVNKMKMEKSIIPYVLFVFRGICYLSISNFNNVKKRKKTAYVASPNRMEALKYIVNADDLNKIISKKNEYLTLVDQLPLPENGYNFSILKNTIPYENTSNLAMSFSNLHPKETLKKVLHLRKSDEVKKIKVKWGGIFEEDKSYAVGAVNQSISNSHVSGNLIQKIYIAKSQE